MRPTGADRTRKRTTGNYSAFVRRTAAIWVKIQAPIWSSDEFIPVSHHSFADVSELLRLDIKSRGVVVANENNTVSRPPSLSFILRNLKIVDCVTLSEKQRKN